MEDEEFRVSKNLLKTLTVETRTNILKALERRPMTASELSRFLGKHVTTVTEHLDLLKDSELVERIERPGRKWVYYKLTKPGEQILQPKSYRWVFVLTITFMTFFGSWYFVTANSYPGQPFYILKRSVENFQLALSQGSLERAQLHIQHANERLEETKHVAGTGNVGLVNSVIDDYETEIEQARTEIEKAKTEKKDVTPVLETFSESTAKQSAMLKNIAIKSPMMAPSIGSALNISEQGHVEATQELVDITQKMSSISE